jgi:hypothetical protein
MKQDSRLTLIDVQSTPYSWFFYGLIFSTEASLPS